MISLLAGFVSVCTALSGCATGRAEDVVEADVVVYGSYSAAIAARRAGRTAVIVSPETRIGWLSQLYVLEAQRLVGDYVMTEANCRAERVAKRPVRTDAFRFSDVK